MRSEPDEQGRPQHVKRAEEAALGVGDHAERNLNQEDDHQADQSERKKREPGLFSPGERERQQRRCPQGKSQPLGIERGQRKAVVEIQERKRNHQPRQHQADSRDKRHLRRRKARCRRDGVGRLHGREYTRVVYRALWRKSLPPLRAIVFDAYGTLFDVHSVIALCEQLWPGKGAALSQLWRAKQLEYTWQRSLMRRYEDFAMVTEASLRYACAALGLPVDEERSRSLMSAYLRLSTFPEARDVLAALKASKLRLAILSNGSPAMLRPLVAAAGLGSQIKTILSVDARKIYKPAPAVYQLAVETLRAPKTAI